MEMPAVAVVVVMRMTPIRPRVRRTIPSSRNPYISTSIDAPIAVHPRIAWSRSWRPSLVSQRRRCPPNRYPKSNLRLRRHGKCCESAEAQSASKKLQLPVRFDVQDILLGLQLGWMQVLLHKCDKEPVIENRYLFKSGCTSETTFFATTALPFAVACVLSACIMPGTPYTPFSKNGSIGTRYFFASSS